MKDLFIECFNGSQNSNCYKIIDKPFKIAIYIIGLENE